MRDWAYDSFVNQDESLPRSNRRFRKAAHALDSLRPGEINLVSGAPPLLFSIKLMITKSRTIAFLLSFFLSTPGFADWIADGPEIPVNQTTFGRQLFSDAAMLSGGRYVIAWQGEMDGGPIVEEVVYRVYEANGTPVTDERAAMTISANSKPDIGVAPLHNGGFVIVWTALNFANGTSGDDVVGQRFDANGDKVGSEFQVNATIAGNQAAALVVPFAGGGFLVVYETNVGGGNGFDHYLRLYDANGSVTFGDIAVAQNPAADQRRISGASLTDGRILLVWDTAPSTFPDQNGVEVKGRIFQGNGPQGDEFLVNTTQALGQSAPAACALPDGGALVAWTSSGQDGDGDGIYFQRYAGTGGDLLQKVGGEVRANTYTADQQRKSAVASFPDGSFFVAWQSESQSSNPSEDGDFAGVFGQAFAADGSPVDSQVAINLTTADQQEEVTLLAVSPGLYRAVWMSYEQDGDSEGLFKRDIIDESDPGPPPPPVALSASGPSSVNWKIRRGGKSRSRKSFVLGNAGSLPVSFQISGFGGWLGTSAQAGTLPAGTTTQTQLFLNPRKVAKLRPRTYRKTVSISDTTNSTLVKTVAAKLVVRR